MDKIRFDNTKNAAAAGRRAAVITNVVFIASTLTTALTFFVMGLGYMYEDAFTGPLVAQLTWGAVCLILAVVIDFYWIKPYLRLAFSDLFGWLTGVFYFSRLSVVRLFGVLLIGAVGFYISFSTSTLGADIIAGQRAKGYEPTTTTTTATRTDKRLAEAARPYDAAISAIEKEKSAAVAAAASPAWVSALQNDKLSDGYRAALEQKVKRAQAKAAEPFSERITRQQQLRAEAIATAEKTNNLELSMAREAETAQINAHKAEQTGLIGVITNLGSYSLFVGLAFILISAMGDVTRQIPHTAQRQRATRSGQRNGRSIFNGMFKSGQSGADALGYGGADTAGKHQTGDAF